MHLKFKAFRAISDLSTCLNFKEEHVNVLKDYGITNITTNNDDWMYNPNIYCIVAQSPIDDKVLGGVRIQISDENNLLPVEQAIGKMDNRIYNIVKNFRNTGGVGELCALWNAKAVAGVGVSTLLVRAAIAMSNQLPIGTLMCICADYTLKMFQQVGFIVDNSLGMNGEFPYPNQTYTARVLGIMNSITLGTAEKYDKQRMESLRENPIQQAIELGNMKEIKIDYNLILVK
jgi:hypothetical protein